MAKREKSKASRASRGKWRGKATHGRVNPLANPNRFTLSYSSRKEHTEAGKKKTAANGLAEGQAAAEEPNHSRAAKSTGRPEQRKRRRKQVRLSVAMRKIGLDEYMVAEGLAGLIESLGKNRGEAKVLLDALKESTRVLEPPPKAQDTSESDGSNGVVLRHDVPRPARNVLQDQSVTEHGAE